MTRKWPIVNFFNFLQSFYTLLGSHVCNGIKIVWLWFDNRARSSPKMTKKQSFLNFLQFFQILSLRFEWNFLQSFHTILGSYVCHGIKIVWLWFDNRARSSPKMTKKQPFLNFLQIFQILSLRFERNPLVILHHISVLNVQWQQNRVSGIW